MRCPVTIAMPSLMARLHTAKGSSPPPYLQARSDPTPRRGGDVPLANEATTTIFSRIWADMAHWYKFATVEVIRCERPSSGRNGTQVVR
jgi:hypothetical protein